MPLTRREKAGYATAGVGTGLVWSGAQTTDRGIERMRNAVHQPRKKLPGLNALRDTRGLGKVKGVKGGRAMFAGGNAMRAAGTVGVLGGASQVHQGRKWRKNNPNNKIIQKGLLREGLKGNLEAVRQRGENLKEKKPLGALAIPTAVGVGAASAGSFGAHAALDRSRFKGTKSRPGLVAMGGLTGLAASSKVSNKVLERTHPEYKVTPTGVQRKKKAPVRPSSKAAHFNEKTMGQGSFRRATVPGEFGKSATMTDRQKRAAVFAAGSIPVVGDFSAAATAGRLSRPENQKKAAATQLAGNLGGSLAGGAAGLAAAGEIARRNPSGAVARGAEGLNRRADKMTERAMRPIKTKLPPKPASTPSANGAARSVWNKARKAPGKLMPTRYKGVSGGVLAGGALAGQMVGGQTGGYNATSINLRRDRRAVAKALVVINQGQKVDHKANRAAARRKKISGGISTAGGVVGTGAFGMMVAAKRPSIAAKAPKLADQARDTGLVGGGIGGANALYYGRLQRKEAKELTGQRSRPTTQKVYKSETIRRHAKKGQANVRLSTLEAHRRAPGLRFGNKAYTAELAQRMKREGYDKSRPVHVQLWNGKEVFIDDGAHRMWAADMAGRKTVPIKITQHSGRNPRQGSGIHNRVFDDVRTARFRHVRHRTTGLDDRQLARLAAKKPKGVRADLNAKWAARGERRASVRKAMPNVLSVPKPLTAPKALSVIKPKTYKSSTLVRRQTASGNLVQTRRKAHLG